MAQAEKFKIFEAEIDVNKATENVRALKSTLQNLKEEANKVKASQGELSDEYIQYQAAIKSVSGELRQAEKVTKTVIDAQNANDGSLKQLKAQLALVTTQWNELSEEERLNSDVGKRLTAQKKALTEQLTSEEKATGDARRQVGFYERAMQGNVEAVGQYVPAAGRAAKAAKMLGAAFNVMLGPIGIAIAIIATIVKAFQTFFTSTEAGQNKLRMLQMVFSTVFDTINRILVRFAEVMIWAFTEPQEAVEQLWNKIKENFLNRLDGIVESLKALGKILQGVWELDWDKIKAGGIDYANATVKAWTGVEGAVGKAKKAMAEFAEEQKRRLREAQRIAKMQDELDVMQREALVKLARLESDVMMIREQAANKDEVSARDRLKLLDEAIEKEDEIERTNIAILKQKLAIRQAQNDLTLSKKEDIEAEKQLQAELIRAEGAAAKRRRRLAVERLSAIREIQKEEQDRAKAAIEQMEKELELFRLTNRDKVKGSKELTKELIAEEEARLNEINTRQLAALKASFDAGLTSEMDYNIERLKLEQDLQDSVDSMRSAYIQQREQAEQDRLMREAERLKMNLDNELALAENNLFRRLDVERKFLDKQQELELQAAEAIGADKELIREKYRQIDKQLEYEKEMAKWNIASQFANQIAALFGEQTRLGKAAAVAATAINTYKGAMAAFAETPGGIVIKSAAAALATATGIKAISDIMKVKTNITAGGGGVGTPSVSTTTASLPTPTAVTPQLGSSIATQPANNAMSRQSDMSQNTVLVVDDVTSKQMNSTRNRKIGSI